MLGLCFSNKLISRDEGLHCDFACLLHSKLINKLPESRIVEIVSSAVKIEMKFIVDALPVELIGMNLAITMMCNYIRFCTDQLLLSLGCGRHYKIGNPFKWMETISLQGTNLSRKLDASLRYLQLQLGSPHNPLLLDYSVWDHLAPLSWVKMLWQTLHYFDVHLYMAYPSIAPPREREIFHSLDLSQETMLSLSRCQVFLESIFLSDITTGDSRYLEDFVFNPGGRDWSSLLKFPREVPTRGDWNRWFDFWHSFTTTGDKLKVPLGNWINPIHCIWKWYYRTDSDDLQWVEGKTMFHCKPAAGFRFTRSTRTYHMTHEEPLSPAMAHGLPISVTGFSAH